VTNPKSGIQGCFFLDAMMYLHLAAFNVRKLDFMH